MIPKELLMTGPELRASRERLDLTQIQLGMLARKTTLFTQRQAVSVGKWENGTRTIPPASAELLAVKFYLLETQRATFEELVNMTLLDLLKRSLETRKGKKSRVTP